MAVTVAPASAATVLTFTDQTPGTTANSATATAAGITVTASNPVGGPFPATGGINSVGQGLCVFAQNNASGSRCGYFSAPADSTTSLTGLDLSFDTSVFIIGFDIGLINGLNGGTISFGATSPVSFSGTGFKPLSSPLLVEAGTPLSVVTTGNFTNINDPGGIVRIQSITVEEVPGPLPLFGAASAFAYSRQIRKKCNLNNSSHNTIKN